MKGSTRDVLLKWDSTVASQMDATEVPSGTKQAGVVGKVSTTNPRITLCR